MGGEHERQRNEPSFTEEGIDSLGSEDSASQVDLDHLLNEIDKRMATPSSRSSLQHGEGEEASLHDEPPAPAQPEQSALDFGTNEQTYGGERYEPFPDHSDDNLRGDEPMSRGVLMAGGAVVALSLLCGVVGLFVAFGASGKIEALQQSVDALQTKLATLQVSGDPRVGQLQAEQAGLSSRIDELSMKMDTQAASPAKGSDAQLSELRKRLDALEHKAPAPVKSASAAPASTPTKSTSAKPAATPASSSGEWTVIMVSYPSSAQAESERSRLQKLGIHTEVFKSTVDGKTWYRVRVPGYASQEKAKAAIASLESKTGMDGAWVAHR